jgi:hypothetical protein
MISYHFYATPSADQPRETQGFTAFEEAEGFLTGVRFIEQIRGRLSPATGTMVNEVGMIADHLLGPDGRIPEYYWNLASAVYAYLWSRLAELGKLLLVNKRDRIVTVAVAGLGRASMAHVDGSTDGIGTREVSGEAVDLQPYAVAVMSIGP